MIFGSGDDRLAADLAGMDWIEFVTVKKATAADSAIPRPVEEARGELTAKARVAVENLKAGKTRAMKVSMPMTAGLRAVYPASLTMLEGIPGINYKDSMVTFPADSMRHAYDVMVKLIGVASAGYTRVMQRTVASDPAGPALMKKIGAAMEQAWYDYESGRWQAPPRREPPAGKKYHGYQ